MEMGNESEEDLCDEEGYVVDRERDMERERERIRVMESERERESEGRVRVRELSEIPFCLHIKISLR